MLQRKFGVDACLNQLVRNTQLWQYGNMEVLLDCVKAITVLYIFVGEIFIKSTIRGTKI